MLYTYVVMCVTFSSVNICTPYTSAEVHHIQCCMYMYVHVHTELCADGWCIHVHCTCTCVLADNLFFHVFSASSDLQDHPETAVWCCEQVGVAQRHDNTSLCVGCMNGSCVRRHDLDILLQGQELKCWENELQGLCVVFALRRRQDNSKKVGSL